MGLTIDGTDIIFTGIDVTIVNGFDSATGVAYLVLTASGGFGTLPFQSEGAPGLPPVLNMTLVEVDPDDDLPATNPVVTLTDAGGSGVASAYDVEFHIHKGDDGSAGSFAILDATDITGSETDYYVLRKTPGAATMDFSPQLCGGQWVPSSIVSTSGNGTGRLLASVNIPAQPFDWRPRCFGQCVVSGTANTRVDLVARVVDETTGDQVGYGFGLAGATPPTVIMLPAAPTASAIPGTYAKVSAGVGATVYFRAEQKAATSDSWTTTNTTTSFWVEVAPIPSGIGSGS